MFKQPLPHLSRKGLVETLAMADRRIAELTVRNAAYEKNLRLAALHGYWRHSNPLGVHFHLGTTGLMSKLGEAGEKSIHTGKVHSRKKRVDIGTPLKLELHQQ